MTEDIEWLGNVFPTLGKSEKIQRLYKLADQRALKKTDHSQLRHGLPVMWMGTALVDEIERYYPGTFSEVERVFAIPGTCEFHDLFKGWTVTKADGTVREIHHIKVARELDQMLAKMGVPRLYRRIVTYPVRYHRTSGILKDGGLEMPEGLSADERAVWEMRLRTLAVLVLADKCVGDRDRVRENRAAWIEFLRSVGLAKFYFDFVADQDSKNNFATYSIQKAKLCVDPTDRSENPRGAIVLRIDLDEKVCSLEQILKVEWFSEAFHCCGKAAQYLGFSFRIVTRSVNGSCSEEFWSWSKELKRWTRREPANRK
ncbi:MAG TPA: hypothetical protein V6C89_21670 [Drouetiella sp.]